eukprot:SAG22_NODE_1820_length_3514_cov_2.304539_7_plen_91_part_00
MAACLCCGWLGMILALAPALTLACGEGAEGAEGASERSRGEEGSGICAILSSLVFKNNYSSRPAPETSAPTRAIHLHSTHSTHSLHSLTH